MIVKENNNSPEFNVLDILAFLGIHTIEEVKRNPLTKSFEKKYPRCFEFLKNTVKWYKSFMADASFLWSICFLLRLFQS